MSYMSATADFLSEHLNAFNHQLCIRNMTNIALLINYNTGF